MSLKATKMVRPDAKGRIALGHLTDGISSFAVTKDKHNRIILIPYAEIPAYEKWLFENKIALNKVENGIRDSGAARVSSRGSFAKYIDEKK